MLDDKDTEFVKRYYELRQKKIALEIEIEEASQHLLEIFSKNSVESAEYEQYIFKKRTFSKWEYSEDCKTIQDCLTQKRKEEKENGLAKKLVGKEFLAMVSPKS